jgi:dihydropyrimidinase (EC 3.5.2.2)
MCVTSWNKTVFDEMKVVIEEKGINSFKHFMAYKGSLMVDDDEMFSSFQRLAELGGLPMVHAENGDVVAQMQAKLTPRVLPAPRRMPTQGRLRLRVKHQSRHHAGRLWRARRSMSSIPPASRRMRRSVAPGRRACASTASR